MISLKRSGAAPMSSGRESSEQGGAHVARSSSVRNHRGFSLVELLVVIVILGILAGVVVFAVSGITDRGEASACATDAQTMRTAVEAYRAKNSPSAQPTEAQLVSGGFLVSESKYYDVSGYSGNQVQLTPQPGASVSCPAA